ncbi:MAG: HEAT repeat domain-containing protein, partial [Planctomycetota bacterium]|nr:HEAT repeat domain-containing protein [Planctomycetota bacterium]
MIRTLTLAGFILTLAMLGASSSGLAQDRLELVEHDVVVFMGGANMLHLQQDGHLEAILTQEFAASRPKFRDLSWEADTVFQQGTVVERWRQNAHFEDLGGLGDLDRQLERLGATVVIAQFGALESMRGVESLAQFTEACEELVDTLQKRTRTVVLVTPTPFEDPPSPLLPDLTPRNAVLARFVESIETIAARRKLVFVDLFTAAKPGLTDNGMHVAPKAQKHLADEIARQLGIGRPSLAKTSLETLRQAIVEKHRLWYDYWRPANWKLIYGDDARRQFTRGGEHYISFQEEWQTLVPLIDRAEQRVWQIAGGGEDPGPNRPAPEKLHGDPSADVDQELAAFETTDELHVNLFASEREGLTSPLAIRWDPAGRAYVTVTTTYPHVVPGDLPNDKVILLEDTDSDGVADKSTVFADGLNIPTGLEWGEGGLFVGQNTEILFLKDTDGDGRADSRRVVLGGFGNGDTHQTINSFRWSPDGELYFGHGDGCESRVETPWGASNLFNAGFYRFRPRRLQLLPFLEGHMGPGNPWGIEFDEWGQAFNVDGAGGVNWLNPGLVSTSHVLPLSRIGEPGGYCGIGYLDGSHLPESMRGDFVTGDFKQNRVKRFSVTPGDSGFALEWKEPILRSRHRNFRPVDVKVGPDGAIYVVDWYNPITCHQDDAYRDPTRDKAHGRIWRLSSKNPPIHPPNLEGASIADVVESLRSSEYWTRYQAKREMTRRDPAQVAEALNHWVRTLDPKDPQYEHHLVEAIGAYATIEVVEPKLLNRLLNARDSRARAFAAHLVGRWHDRLNAPLDLLEERITDEHPQVRMEAVVACSAIPSARSVETAARVLDKPTDVWIDYVFRQSIHGLKTYWLPAFQRGDVSFARPDHLAAVLNETEGSDVLDHLKQLVDSENLNAATRARAIAAILATGGPEELRDYGLDTTRFTRSGEYDAAAHAAALSRLIEVARLRDVRPAGDLASLLSQLADHAQPDVQSSALALAGLWKVDELQATVVAVARDKSAAIPARAAAFQAMADMKLPVTREVLVVFTGRTNPPELRSSAIESLAIVDLPTAAA